MGTAHHPRALLAILASTLALAGCHAGHADPTSTLDPTPAASTSAPTGTPAPRHGRDQLDTIPIRDEDSGAHYQRADWGDWTTHPDGCTTRSIVLRAQGTQVTTTAHCRITAGTWTSPYDGAVLTDPTAVQIDHRVPVKEAQRSGARSWTRAQRERLYNDPENLVAVSAKANTAKGDRDPAHWRPSNRDTWCSYAAAYITTKHTYGLSVDQPEHDALAAMLTTCQAGDRR